MALGRFKRLILGTGLTGTDNGDDTLTIDGSVTTYGTPSLTLGTTNAAGATDESIRRDATILAFDATVPSTQAFGDTAATGSATVAARRDHKHAMPATPTSVSGNAGTATALQTSRNIDGQAFNGTTDITVIAPGTHAATGKTTPVDADELPLSDSAASFVLKKVTWLNLKATLKTYFDGIYASVSGGSGAFMATDTIWDTKGDIAVATGANAAVVVPAGVNGSVPIADSAQTAGVVSSWHPSNSLYALQNLR